MLGAIRETAWRIALRDRIQLRKRPGNRLLPGDTLIEIDAADVTHLSCNEIGCDCFAPISITEDSGDLQRPRQLPDLFSKQPLLRLEHTGRISRRLATGRCRAEMIFKSSEVVFAQHPVSPRLSATKFEPRLYLRLY